MHLTLWKLAVLQCGHVRTTELAIFEPTAMIHATTKQSSAVCTYKDFHYNITIPFLTYTSPVQVSKSQPAPPPFLFPFETTNEITTYEQVSKYLWCILSQNQRITVPGSHSRSHGLTVLLQNVLRFKSIRPAALCLCVFSTSS